MPACTIGWKFRANHVSTVTQAQPRCWTAITRMSEFVDLHNIGFHLSGHKMMARRLGTWQVATAGRYLSCAFEIESGICIAFVFTVPTSLTAVSVLTPPPMLQEPSRLHPNQPAASSLAPAGFPRPPCVPIQARSQGH